MPPREPSRHEASVFVVDDDAAVLDSVSLLLESVGLPALTFRSADAFLEAWNPDHPGCLVLDIRMPGMSGLQLQEHLRAAGSTLPIIFLTAHGDIPMAVRAVKTGAIDFIQKPFRDQEFLDKVQRAIDADAEARRREAERNRVLERIATLTPREAEVMERVVAGQPNKAIAEELGVSQRTIEVHRAHVMSKLRADSLATLVRMAMVVQNHNGR